MVGDLADRRRRDRMLGQPADAPLVELRGGDSRVGGDEASSSASAGARSSATSFDTNPDRNTAMTIPPLAGTLRRISSGTLRGWSVTARAPECEKITGASATSSAAAIVVAATWLRSTSIPSRFISRTTSRPNRVSPPWRGASVAASAQRVVFQWVRVM